MRCAQHGLDFNRRLLGAFSIIFDHRKITLNNTSKGKQKTIPILNFTILFLKGEKK